jgi:hypothetical protein
MLPPSQVLVWSSIVLLVGVAAWFVVAALRYRARFRIEHRVRPVRGPGPAIVNGVVKATTNSAVVRVIVTQVSEFSIDPRYRVWRESDRTVHAEPFDLILSDGEVISVEPGTTPVVMAPLTITKPGSVVPGTLQSRRAMVCSLSAGQRVTISGVVRDSTMGTRAMTAYRAAKSPRVLCPPEGGHMRIAVREDARDRFYVICAVVCLLYLGLETALLFRPVLNTPPAALVAESVAICMGAHSLVILFLVLCVRVRWPAPWYARSRLRENESPP